ncbi:DUF2721 domain-containing protein [Rhizobium ruizarguesonis]
MTIAAAAPFHRKPAMSRGSPILRSRRDPVEAGSAEVQGDDTMSFVPTVVEMTDMFSRAAAPAFFLGAVAAFISLLTARLDAVVARARLLNAIPDGSEKAQMKNDVPRLKTRARLLRNGILLSLGSGLCAGLLLGIVFATGFFGLRYSYGAGILFIVATLLLCGAIVRFAQDVIMDLHEFDYLE